MSIPREPRQDLSRRMALAGGAAMVGASVLATTFSLAQASPHKFKVGDAEVTVFTDGTMAAPLGWVLPDRQRAEIDGVLVAAGRPMGEINLQVNVALLRLGPELVLIDAGAGPDFAPVRGKLPDNLAAAGIAADAITRVIFTHGHPDHLWGVIDPLDGGSLYPKARLHMPAVEVDYWLEPGVETKVPEPVRGSALGTQRRLKELGARIETYRTGAEVLPGLAAVATSGHTPGHASLLLASGGAKLMFGGDALAEPAISFARPAWRWGADWDQDRAIATRQRLLDMLATDRIGLLGYHLPWPGVGRVERSGSGYRFAQT